MTPKSKTLVVVTFKARSITNKTDNSRLRPPCEDLAIEDRETYPNNFNDDYMALI